MSIRMAEQWFTDLEALLSDKHKQIAARVLKEIALKEWVYSNKLVRFTEKVPE